MLQRSTRCWRQLATTCRLRGVHASAVPQAKGDQDSSPISEGKLQRVLKALEPLEVEDLPLTSEERAEAATRAKEYSKRMMHKHREWQIDLTTRIQLRNAAVDALPEHLRAAARQEDLSIFPANRMVPTDTPPILNYSEKQAKSSKKKFGGFGTRA